MIGRLVHKADFERLLAARARLRSAHFALHHVAVAPPASRAVVEAAVAPELSTGSQPACAQAVDSSHPSLWLGCVVPKRHARRAVTRSLLKRQMRQAFERHDGRLPAGHWLLRLQAGFPVSQFVSAASRPLAQAVRAELDGLLARAAR